MSEYGYNSKYLLKDGKPWFPVMGEFHYSRFPKEYWKESLYKMRSGGVSVVSSYVIWFHHEEIQGEFNFEGNCDLRTFVKNIDECGLKMILRVGPFCHAEVKNGGFPDWLVEKGYELRSNDPGYMEASEKFLKAVYEQVKGLFDKDGGPIIGLQIENEYGHVGAKKGDECLKHMNALTQMVKDIGYDVPIFTATGWGGATIGECIPVMGGYCEAPWERSSDELPPSTNYVITYERDDHKIGKGLAVGEGANYSFDDFPYLTAELGGGLAVTHRRRPIASAKDIGGVSLAKLASGVNLLGYYMYHGGINPQGKTTRLNETIATGGYCDLAEFDYDFNAPIGAYGQVSDTYKELKLLTMFIKDFGSELCKMPSFIPESTPDVPDNLTDLRMSVRSNGKSGYVFVNNYQRRYEMAEHPQTELKAHDDEGNTYVFDPVDIKNGDYFFYPFNLKVGDLVIDTVTSTPLCILKNENGFEDTAVFYGKDDTYEDTMFYVNEEDEDSGLYTDILNISKTDALNAYKVTFDRDYLIVTDSVIINMEEGYEIIGGKDDIQVYPWTDVEIPGYEYKGQKGDFAVYSNVAKGETKLSKTHLLKADVVKEFISNPKFVDTKDVKTIDYVIKPQYPENMDSEPINDYFMDISYYGDIARLYIDGKIVNDQFYTGKPWTLGLKQYGFPKEITVEIVGLLEDNNLFLENPVKFEDGVACIINKIMAKSEYKKKLKFTGGRDEKQ